MRIKDVHKAATMAWSPTNISPVYVAAGSTAAEGLGVKCKLEILAVEPADSSLDMPQVGYISTDFSFKKLAWNDNLQKNDFGILAASASDTKIYLYGVGSLIKHEEEPAVLCALEKHSEAAGDLDFNPFQKNLLASSAKAGELYIWDLNQIERDPLMIGSKLQTVNTYTNVNCVAWNMQVPHIVASSSSVGHTVVWDMRKTEKPVITFNTGNALVNCHSISWHPRVATQLVQANATEPIIQMWDVRNMQYPIKIFSEHKRGIHTVAWCNQDADMLASCGKDNKVLIWNPNGSIMHSDGNVPSGELVYEIPCNSCIDVRWCPRMPVLVSLMTVDDYIQIYSIISGSQKQQSQFAEQQHKQISEAFGSDFANTSDVPNSPKLENTNMPMCPKYPPKCLKISVGASFTFGGKLIALDSTKDLGSTKVTLSQVVTNELFIERAKKLDRAITNDGSLISFCDERITESGDEYEALQWGFLKANLLEEPRKKIIELLDCYNHNMDEELSHVSPLNDHEAIQDDNPLQDIGMKHMEILDAPATIGRKVNDKVQVDENKPSFQSPIKADSTNGGSFTISFSDESEKLLGKLLLVGNLGGAVEACMNADKMAEAILLAVAAGPEILKKARSSFFSKRTDNLSRLIHAIISRDWSDIVKECSLSNWREILTILLTYARADEFTQFCATLGQRMESASNADYQKYAGLCYICAGRADDFASWWMKMDDLCTSMPMELQNLMEKIVLLKKSVEIETGSTPVSSTGATSKIFSRYAGLLCAEGQLQLAMNYLETSTSTRDQVCSLKERLYHALNLSSFAENQQKSKQIPTSYTKRTDGSIPAFQKLNNPAPGVGGLSYNTSIDNTVVTSSASKVNLFTPYSKSTTISGTSGASTILDPKRSVIMQDENRSHENWSHMSQPVPSHEDKAPKTTSWKNESKSLTAWNDPPMLVENYRQSQAFADKEPIIQPIPGNNGGERSAKLGLEGQRTLDNSEIVLPKTSAYQPSTDKFASSEKLQKPIPASHMVLYEIFNNQIEKGRSRLTDPARRRKLDDIARRLATLYDLLREEILSPDILQGLHDIAQAMKVGDYNGGIKLHKAVIARGNFSQITSFMPGLKMLMQLSLQYKI